MARSRMVYSGMNPHHAGAVAEHMVASDLYLRGALEITWPDNQHSADDMHVRFLSGWYSVQVKAGRENSKTGVVIVNKRGHEIKSHVLAVVAVQSGRIRYLPAKSELPENLRAAV